MNDETVMTLRKLKDENGNYLDLRPVTMRPIVERFAINDQIGYIAYEFLDGKLVRQQAIKVLRVK